MDISTISQGLTPQSLVRIQQFAKRKNALWEAAMHLASSQPLTTSLHTSAMADLQRASDDLRSKSGHLVVVGTGGASLGAQALCALSAQTKCVHFIKNCDAQSIARLFDSLPLGDTAWLMISKSGETMETLAVALAVKALYQKAGLHLAPRVQVITSTHTPDNTMAQLAQENAWPVLMHPANLGGRFSVFSVVGMMPLAYAGIDIRRLMAEVDAHFIARVRSQDSMLFESACWFAASLPEQPLHVLMAYGDRLGPLTQWYKQLWAESLGKNLIGPTPITAIGATDQHSQLQLYLGGPRDKLFTVLAPNDATAPMHLAASNVAKLDYLHERSMQDMMQASAQATIDTLRAHNIPLRCCQAPWDIAHVATLMVDMMLETLLVAAMMDVDPFDQPAVEEGKIRARQALAEGHVNA